MILPQEKKERGHGHPRSNTTKKKKKKKKRATYVPVLCCCRFHPFAFIPCQILVGSRKKKKRKDPLPLFSSYLSSFSSIPSFPSVPFEKNKIKKKREMHVNDSTLFFPFFMAHFFLALSNKLQHFLFFL
ncbi:MAG: hypothetical protein J3R72DRAFT_235250 [Linnemannia gamsii]|nr:MAG: hypothetical protein J3R72DRAFT_235250 [Linnemannia gamsii]